MDAPPIAIGLREAYAGMLERGQHPPVFLFIEADPTGVDVNVHPAKREVRFHDGRGIQELVREAVRAALAAASAPRVERPRDIAEVRGAPADSDPPADGPEPAPGPGLAAIASPPVTERTLPLPESPPAAEAGARPPAVSESAPATGQATGLPERAPFQLIGKLGERYLILESDEGLVLLHRRAAHERVLFEEAIARMEAGGVESQPLLSPAVLQLTPEDFQIAVEHQEALEKLGVGFAEFGENTIKIDSLPAHCGAAEPEGFVARLVADLREGGARAGRRQNERQIAAAVSHRVANYGEATHRAESEALVSRLMACEMPYCDPRGRATLVQFSYQELARKFGERPR